MLGHPGYKVNCLWNRLHALLIKVIMCNVIPLVQSVCGVHSRGPSTVLQGVPSELRLGFVDLDFECSTVCPTLLWLMGIWQKRLGRLARWWNTDIKVSPTQVSAHLGHPVPHILMSSMISTVVGG